MILQLLFSLFKNRKLLFSKKADMAFETVIFFVLLLLFVLVVFFLIARHNAQSVNIVDQINMFKGATYDGK